MLVKTIIKTVSSEDEESNRFQSVPIEIIATIPEIKDTENKRIPISITLRHVNDSQEMSKLQCYHYAIPKRDSSDIIDVPLLDTPNNWISEVTRKISISTAKKYHKPCYTAWSSSEAMSNGISPMDQLYILKKCINLLDTLIV
ncbi:proteasome chaperone 4 [Monosporozyma unispora]